MWGRLVSHFTPSSMASTFIDVGHYKINLRTHYEWVVTPRDFKLNNNVSAVYVDNYLLIWNIAVILGFLFVKNKSAYDFGKWNPFEIEPFQLKPCG